MSSLFTFTTMGDDLPTRLAETIAWCRSWAVVDVARALRTEAFRPWLLEPDRAAVVEVIARRRSARVRDAGAPPAPVTRHAELEGGRLLVFCPDRVPSPRDACPPHDESRGYFDRDRTPPWDTWVALGADPDDDVAPAFLLAWVPPTCIELAHRGIWAEEVTCLAWLHDTALASHPELAPLCP